MHFLSLNFIKKRVFRGAALLAVGVICLTGGTALGNSIIATLLAAAESVVHVEVRGAALREAPKRNLVRTPDGRVLAINNVKPVQFKGEGAGVIIHPSGLIVTNQHTVKIAEQGTVTVTLKSGRRIPAKVLKLVPGTDIAFLKIKAPEPLPYLEMANSDTAKLRDKVYTIGSSDLLNNTISEGKINGIGEKKGARAKGKPVELIRVTFNVYKGDSGSPLFDAKGRFLGLMAAKQTNRSHTSFAIPANKIKRHALEIMVKKP